MENLQESLEIVLERYAAAARPLAAPEPLGNAGGSSGARLWRFHCGQGALAARAWPPEGPDRSRLNQIHRWLNEARPTGFVPVPLRALDGQSVQEQAGRCWEVVPWMPGAADRSRPPRSARLKAGFAGLAAFHLRLAQRQVTGPSPGFARRLRDLLALESGGLRALAEAVPERRADAIALAARRWLELAARHAAAVTDLLRAAAPRTVVLQPCLRDVRGDHLLFVADQLAGLVDFGAMDVETSATDLARLLDDWVGTDRAARALALESYAARRPLEDAETALIEVFSRSAALLGGGLWVRWHFLEGRTFDNPEVVRQGLERCLERLEQLEEP